MRTRRQRSNKRDETIGYAAQRRKYKCLNLSKWRETSQLRKIVDLNKEKSSPSKSPKGVRTLQCDQAIGEVDDIHTHDESTCGNTGFNASATSASGLFHIEDQVHKENNLRHIEAALGALKVLNATSDTVEGGLESTMHFDMRNCILNSSIQSSSGRFLVTDLDGDKRNETELSSSGTFQVIGDFPLSDPRYLHKPIMESKVAHSTPIKIKPKPLTDVAMSVAGCSQYYNDQSPPRILNHLPFDPAMSPIASVSGGDIQNVSEALNGTADAIGLGCETLESSFLEHEIPIVCDKVSHTKPLEITGRRLSDMGYVFQSIWNEKHSSGTDCNFMNMHLEKELLDGNHSTWVFKCDVCNIRSRITSEDPSKRYSYMHINDAVVNGVIAMGSGYAGWSTFSSAVDMPCMAPATFIKHQNKVAVAIRDAAYIAMCEAAKEEIAIALAEGNVDAHGNPMCTVVADGCWCRRCYKSRYDSLSGVACIVGYRTRKVLFIGIRNRYCCVCARAKTLAQDAPQHLCYLNWTKSATSMEADIVAEGFKTSVAMHGLIYNKLIGDGDSSVHQRLRVLMPYGPNLLVEKIECRNHILRNYSNKVSELASNTKSGYPVGQRQAVKSNVLRLRMAVAKAIQFRKAQPVPLQEKIHQLKMDIENGPYHVLGQHTKCGNRGYFCTGEAKEGEVNLVPAMALTGVFGALLKIVYSSVSRHASSLIFDVDNNPSENYNSVVNKFVGGKRINFALRGSYSLRCQAAVVSFNSRGNYIRLVHKSMMGNSPGTHTKRFVDRTCQLMVQSRKRRLEFPATKNKKFRAAGGPDEHYGLLDSNNPMLEEMTQEKYESERRKFLADLLKTADERADLERDTIDQANSQDWHTERKKRLTASWFGKVCHLRPSTSCRNTVHSILYGTVKTRATEHGVQNEPVAKALMADTHGVKAEDCGLFVDEDFPYLAASPDGLVGEDSIMEVKCPYSADGFETPEDAMTAKKIPSCDIVDGKLLLKPTDNYFFQVQGQLHITKRRFCYFVIYTKNWLSYEKIERDDEFWELHMVENLKRFYMDCLLPEIICRRYALRLEKQDIKDPQRITDAIVEAEARRTQAKATSKKAAKKKDKKRVKASS